MALDQSFFQEMEARIPKGKVRTRFAPSPTGYMHVGNLRTALYTWLIARHAGGTFILRIEDTDQGRLVEGATDVIYRTMAECGLTHDEGPDVGGPVGPYIQSERRDLYQPYAHLLVEKGAAYYCFCEKAASEEDAGDFDRADDPCRDLSPEEARQRVEAGEPYVIRQRIPHEGTTTFHDVSFGDITVENKTLDDQVLLKRDGLPTYNFANVVDDHLMGITHVVRGSEYLSSAPKYNLLYEAFGWDIPTYVHCSPVMRDQHNKMSKRHGDPSYEDLKAQGYLTEAILNYVALLGWAPKGERSEQEIFSLSELVEAFDIAGISKSPAIFDIDKLTYFNATYLRAMAPEDFAKAAEPYIREAVKNPAIDVSAVAALLQARCEKLTEIPEKVDFFDQLPDYGVECFTNSPVMRDQHNKMSKRHGDPSYEDLKAQGYLTEAILNYVALLGWAPKGERSEQEIFSLSELVEAFDIAGISKSPAIFDIDKLTYFNATYLRAMAPEDFAKAAEPYIREAVKNPAIDVSAVAALLQARCEKLTEIPEKVDFFDQLPDYGVECFTNKKSKTNPEVSQAMLEAAIPALEGIGDWTADAVHDTLIALAEHLGVKNATLMWPVRIAAAGKLVTPGGAVEICHILGKDETLRRLRLGLDKLRA